jgi:hypothetical protein
MGNCENQMQYDIPISVYSGFLCLIYMVEIPNIILDGACFCVVSLQAYEPWTLSCIDENFSYVRKILPNYHIGRSAKLPEK